MARFGILGLSIGVGLLALPAVCWAQATVSAVTDAAGYGPRVAPGSLASIFGANLASSEDQAASFPLPTTLGGTTVEIQGTLVPLLYASATQINFQVPASLASGQASLIVHAPSGDSSSFTFTVLSQAPAIFQYGANHAIAQNIDAANSLNSSTAPAAAGSVITVYLTGQGAVDNPVADGMPAPDSPLANATATFSATIEFKDAPVQFLGLTPGYAGLAQANIQVPTLPTGDYPLVLTIGGIVSASAVISVSGTGTPFTSPLTLVGTASFVNSLSSSVALSGTTAYVCGANHITMVDVSNAAQPAVIGEFGDSQLNGNGTICAINSAPSSPYLVDVVRAPLNTTPFVDSFAVYDITSPRAPVLLGVTATSYPYIVSLSFFDNFAFASTSYITFATSSKMITNQTGEFLAFDFTNPAAPQFITTLSATSGSNANLDPYSAVFDQLYAFVASTTATGSSTSGVGVLDIVNITTPTAMTSINEIQLSPAAIALSFAFTPPTLAPVILLVVGNTTGNRSQGTPDFGFTGTLTLATLDVSNPAAPILLSNLDTGIQVNAAFNTAAFANGVFAVVANAPVSDYLGPQSLLIVDARQPSNPILYPVQTQFGFGGVLTTSTGYLLAPNALGLNIYLLQYQ
jgi:uncharacterized protein (TIGR03437 family)